MHRFLRKNSWKAHSLQYRTQRAYRSDPQKFDFPQIHKFLLLICCSHSNFEISFKSNNPQCWYGENAILNYASVRALQWISKFRQNKGVCWYFSTYGVFYSTIIKVKNCILCVRALLTVLQCVLFWVASKFWKYDFLLSPGSKSKSGL